MGLGRRFDAKTAQDLRAQRAVELVLRYGARPEAGRRSGSVADVTLKRGGDYSRERRCWTTEHERKSCRR